MGVILKFLNSYKHKICEKKEGSAENEINLFR